MNSTCCAMSVPSSCCPSCSFRTRLIRPRLFPPSGLSTPRSFGMTTRVQGEIQSERFPGSRTVRPDEGFHPIHGMQVGGALVGALGWEERDIVSRGVTRLLILGARRSACGGCGSAGGSSCARGVSLPFHAFIHRGYLLAGMGCHVMYDGSGVTTCYDAGLVRFPFGGKVVHGLVVGESWLGSEGPQRGVQRKHHRLGGERANGQMLTAPQSLHKNQQPHSQKHRRNNEKQGKPGSILTLLHKLGPLDAPPDLPLVPHPAVRHEGLVQARAEVGEAEGVLAAEEEKLWW